MSCHCLPRGTLREPFDDGVAESKLFWVRTEDAETADKLALRCGPRCQAVMCSRFANVMRIDKRKWSSVYARVAVWAYAPLGRVPVMKTLRRLVGAA